VRRDTGITKKAVSDRDLKQLFSFIDVGAIPQTPRTARYPHRPACRVRMTRPDRQGAE
jgi:hypothetical protein